jgi:hypothetical protein
MHTRADQISDRLVPTVLDLFITRYARKGAHHDYTRGPGRASGA